MEGILSLPEMLANGDAVVTRSKLVLSINGKKISMNRGLACNPATLRDRIARAFGSETAKIVVPDGLDIRTLLFEAVHAAADEVIAAAGIAAA